MLIIWRIPSCWTKNTEITGSAVPGEVLECQKPVTVELFEIIFSQSQIQESL
jgi:hypothetical protein